MKIQFIYSFENEPQQIVTLPFSESFLHSGKDALIDFALSDLTEDEKGKVLKISCCLYAEPANNYEDVNNPLKVWYNECNGKIWADDLHSFKKQNNIPELVSDDFLRKFCLSNGIQNI